eukprot:8428661-Pyramimonas_sp.AAC.1
MLLAPTTWTWPCTPPRRQFLLRGRERPGPSGHVGHFDVVKDRVFIENLPGLYFRHCRRKRQFLPPGWSSRCDGASNFSNLEPRP